VGSVDHGLVEEVQSRHGRATGGGEAFCQIRRRQLAHDTDGPVEVFRQKFERRGFAGISRGGCRSVPFAKLAEIISFTLRQVLHLLAKTAGLRERLIFIFFRQAWPQPPSK
jgi:hypothetical protein